MVAESEWGNARAHKMNGLAVMADFAKLLGARCPLKVMVFSYLPDSTSTFEKLTELMTDLISASEDDATYVLFGVSWKEPNEFKHRLVEGCLAGAVCCGP